MLKDPDATLPFTVDWSAWLTAEGDTASSVAWTVPAGLTQDANPPSLANGKATIWLSGGDAGADYNVICRMTTTAGRIDERTLTVMVRDR